jgi:hypothetical protein
MGEGLRAEHEGNGAALPGREGGAMNKLKRIFCALFRHSNIETFFFGYH